MNNAPALVHAIDQLLVEDRKQLQHINEQTDAVHAAYGDLMRRLRLEIESKNGAAGALHLRG